MGKRLIFDVIAIENEEEVVLTSVYYHWSGFTSSTLRIVKDFIEQYKIKEEDLADEYKRTRLQKLILTLDVLYQSGARLSEEDEQKHLSEIKAAQENQKLYIPENYLQSIYELNRNKGIISLEENHSYGDNFIFLNLDEESVEYREISTIESTEDEKILMEWIDENVLSFGDEEVGILKIHDKFKDFKINYDSFESFDDFLELAEYYEEVHPSPEADVIILGPHSLMISVE